MRARVRVDAFQKPAASPSAWLGEAEAGAGSGASSSARPALVLDGGEHFRVGPPPARGPKEPLVPATPSPLLGHLAQVHLAPLLAEAGLAQPERLEPPPRLGAPEPPQLHRGHLQDLRVRPGAAAPAPAGRAPRGFGQEVRGPEAPATSGTGPELGPEQRVVEPEDAAVARGGPEAQALALTPWARPGPPARSALAS